MVIDKKLEQDLTGRCNPLLIVAEHGDEVFVFFHSFSLLWIQGAAPLDDAPSRCYMIKYANAIFIHLRRVAYSDISYIKKPSDPIFQDRR